MRKQGYKITQDGDKVYTSFVMKHEERDAKGDRCSGFLGNFDPLVDGKGGRGYMEKIMLEASKELNRELHKEHPIDLEEYIQKTLRTGGKAGNAGSK